MHSTEVVGAAIAAADQPPVVWLQMSTATIYADRRDGPSDEATGITGGHDAGVPASWKFSVRIARNWEAAQAAADTDPSFSGPVHLAAPGPVTQRDLMREMRRAWGHRPGLPATAGMAQLGAFAMRSDAELLLKSRRVVPGRLLEAGFPLAFATWDRAVVDLVARRRAG